MPKQDAYSVLAERHGYKNSASYRRILEFLMTPNQALIAVDLPLSLDEIAEKHNLSMDEVKSEIDILFRKGVVIPKNFQTLEFPRFARSVTQIHDASQSILDLEIYDQESEKRLFELWEEFSLEELYPNTASDVDTQEEPNMRILAAYRAIKDLPDIQIFDDIREILKEQKLIAVCSCTCRKRGISVGRPCAYSHHINCLQFNRGAEYAITRGTGRKVSYEQAMEIIDANEEDGLVHNFRNDRGFSAPILCSCCIDCCMIWHPVDMYNGDIGNCWAKSRFQAEVDEELCVGCKVCIDRCMFNAISMEKIPGTEKFRAIVDPEKCFGCGVCAVKCKTNALSMKTVRPLEHIPEMREPFRP